MYVCVSGGGVPSLLSLAPDTSPHNLTGSGARRGIQPGHNHVEVAAVMFSVLQLKTPRLRETQPIT